MEELLIEGSVQGGENTLTYYIDYQKIAI